MILRNSIALAAVTFALAGSLSACGSDSESADDAKSSDTPSMAASPSEDMTDDMTDASKPFGPGCASVPADGAGSFGGMATEPVATAASANPLLSTLVTAVTEAGLVDTLNSAEALTVFAPTNDAFAKIPAADLEALLADKEMLTQVLTHHVVGEKLTPENLAGTHETLAGDKITVKGSGEDFTIGDAAVVCGNVQTANATVYIVDSVIMP